MLSFSKTKRKLSNIVEPYIFQRKSHLNKVEFFLKFLSDIFTETFSHIIIELNLNSYNNQWYQFLECNR